MLLPGENAVDGGAAQHLQLSALHPHLHKERVHLYMYDPYSAFFGSGCHINGVSRYQQGKKSTGEIGSLVDLEPGLYDPYSGVV